MPFDWNQIQSKWLYGLPIEATRQELVDAFNQVEKRFGPSFFSDYNWLRGTYIANLVLDLGKIIKGIENGNCKLPENGEVVRNIKENKISSVSSVIRLSACYLRDNRTVEFEPEAYGKKPDLRVNFDGTWIYIEEAKLEVSNRFKVLNRIMDHISGATDTINSNLNVDVILLKEDLNPKEIREIIDKMELMSKMLVQPQKSKKEDFFMIVTYRKGQERPMSEETRPALCQDSLSVGGGFERHLHLEIQFTDIRLDKILKESRQLSPKERNLLLLDISISGGLEDWSKSIDTIFQRGQRCRLGAILLIEEHHFVNSLEIESRMILHPNPSQPLPEGFIEMTERCMEDLKYPIRPQQIF